jgi:hypothetical protein
VFDILRPAKKKAIDDLAHILAQDFIDKYPIALHQGAGNKKTVKKLTSAVDALCIRARDFHQQNGLDIYGKARLNNTLLWELRETGYDRGFIDEVMKKVIISLNAARPAPA